MKDSKIIILLAVVLLLSGGIFFYLHTFHTGFTFYSAELSAEDNKVSEVLHYKPNTEYHTLYRNFITKISATPIQGADSILVTDITCSAGTPYYRDYLNTFHSPQQESVLDYTESNEYGCSFGTAKGFSKSEEYIIGASLILQPITLTEYQGKHYIKFVA